LLVILSKTEKVKVYKLDMLDAISILLLAIPVLLVLMSPLLVLMELELVQMPAELVAILFTLVLMPAELVPILVMLVLIPAEFALIAITTEVRSAVPPPLPPAATAAAKLVIAVSYATLLIILSVTLRAKDVNLDYSVLMPAELVPILVILLLMPAEFALIAMTTEVRLAISPPLPPAATAVEMFAITISYATLLIMLSVTLRAKDVILDYSVLMLEVLVVILDMLLLMPSEFALMAIVKDVRSAGFNPDDIAAVLASIFTKFVDKPVLMSAALD